MSSLTLDAEALYAELRSGVRSLWRPDMVVMGIWSGGAWLAERLVADLPELAELDINPLWVRGDQVEALDALMVWRPDGPAVKSTQHSAPADH